MGRSTNFCALFLANFLIDLDEIWYAAMTCMIDMTKLYIVMAFTSTQGHRVLRKLELVQAFYC